MPRLAFRELGLTPRMRAAMSGALLRKKTGLFLIGSRTGQGRSTTLASVVFDFNPYPSSGSAHKRATGVTRISIIEDIHDARAAERARERVMDGELVFASMIAADVAESLSMLLRFGFGIDQLRGQLRGALHQHLAPRACPQCAVPIWASTSAGSRFTSLVDRVGLSDAAPDDASFIHCRGCEACDQTGELGWIGLFEWINPICLTGFHAEPTPGNLTNYLGDQRDEWTDRQGAGAYISMREDLREKVLDRQIAIGAAADLAGIVVNR